MTRHLIWCVAWAVPAVSLAGGSTVQAALVIEPVFNRVEGSGPADNNFPLFDPEFQVDGVSYWTADEPGEIVSYASGDPRSPDLDVVHVWNNTHYLLTGFTLRLIGTATDSENPGTIVRGPVDAVWGDVNGDSAVGVSDIFANITVSPDRKEIRFENGTIPVGGRFTDIHLAMSNHPPDFAGIDATFSGIYVSEPGAAILVSLAAFSYTLVFRRRRWECAGANMRITLIVAAMTAWGSPAIAATINAINVAELIAAINVANQNSEPDTIVLAPATNFALTQIDNSSHGSTGLPRITANETLEILGNGGVIERSVAAGTPNFRLFDVAAEATLTLENLTLQRGLTDIVSPYGGAIYNAGNLALKGVTVQNNVARGRTGANCVRCRPGGNGGPGWPGEGGGIYSAGSLILENSELRSNQAQGGSGGFGSPGGSQGRGGDGRGGGLYILSGTATLHGSSVTGNGAQGGSGTPSGSGYGGGIYIASAQVALDEFTFGHVTGNTASTNYPNIIGPYDVVPNSNPLPGDYNTDGVVNIGDYVVWRNGLGTTYTQTDYGVWRAHFGQTAGSGAAGYPLGASAESLSAAVPEPASMAQSVVSTLLISVLRVWSRWARGNR